jgi:hypothetical protein
VKYYCPRGAFYPLLVGGGNYSTGGSAHNRTRTAQAICPPGSYCDGAIPILCPMGRFGNRPGLSDQSCAGNIIGTLRRVVILPCLGPCVTGGLTIFRLLMDIILAHVCYRSVPTWFLLPRRNGGPRPLSARRVLHRRDGCVFAVSRRSHHAAPLSARKGLLFPRLGLFVFSLD